MPETFLAWFPVSVKLITNNYKDDNVLQLMAILSIWLRVAKFLSKDCKLRPACESQFWIILIGAE